MFTEESNNQARSRKQAILEGVLIDVTKAAKRYGYRVPVAVTNGVWDRCVRVPAGVSGQNECSRLEDLLQWLALEIREKPSGRHFEFFALVLNANDLLGLERRALQAALGQGDEGETVLTVHLAVEE